MIIPKSVKRSLRLNGISSDGHPPELRDLYRGWDAYIEHYEAIHQHCTNDFNHSFDCIGSQIHEAVEVLYDYVYGHQLSLVGIEYKESVLSELRGWPENLVVTIENLYMLWSVVKEQVLMPFDESNSNTRAVDHFIQSAYVLFCIDFNAPSIFGVTERKKQNASEIIFSAEEISLVHGLESRSLDTIAEAKASKVYKPYGKSKLIQVAAGKFKLPKDRGSIIDYYFPKKGNDINRRRRFFLYRSVMTYLARNRTFMPTQFYYNDSIPEYTSVEFFRDYYSEPIKKLRVNEKKIFDVVGIDYYHLKALRSQRAGMFLQQAIMLDDYLYTLKYGQLPDESTFQYFRETA